MINYIKNNFFGKSSDNTYHIVAATMNPAKLAAITNAFNDVFGQNVCRIESVTIDNSHIPSQPMSDKETRSGARARVMTARQVRPEANFWVGIEAGIEDNMAFAWIVVENAQQRGESRSASLPLPSGILADINQGKELSEVMLELNNDTELNKKQGAIGYFTNNKLTRTTVYHQALVLALVPFINSIYQNK